ncbi:BZ3500_MvSof-1268-A1-R1_Chr3-1g05944 [Microbotryum saponariae]|uniref:BZ3500_MvSof-1268-A1-R1_Chr3-1g05944 protein n=1 Tax=Microbotryum saponariae TaxID=289078 RepID=A0A2X0L4E5_9BASI|nr:BZ3500_MvSof-1268-A1-R1_Chr3-1g05944 [Microbotryum saponariae]SDA05134.1 BZ3501_MvSof-1269-A2-R1_Chr3-1g05614 [Microbotryum saponariae]
MLRRAARALRLGKERYFRGHDLEGNSFYERPGEDPKDWRQTKRTIEYVIARPLGDYQFNSIPAQWNGWLRKTRKEPPTIEELQQDYERMQKLQTNVERLRHEYEMEKFRLAEGKRPDLRIGNEGIKKGVEESVHQRREGTEESVGAGRGEEDKVVEPADLQRGDGEVEVGDWILAEKNRKAAETEREMAQKRREEFAKQVASKPRGNPSDSFQPDAWAPTAAKRR